jgi:beta-lactamase class A
MVAVGELWPGAGSHADEPHEAIGPGAPSTTVRSRAASISQTAAPTTVTPATTSTTTTTLPVDREAENVDGATGVLATPAIASYLQARSGNITAAVYDLATRQLSVWRPGVEDEDTASIVKVDILATLLHEAQEANRSLTASEEELATAMIEQSDNDAATALWDDVGGNTAVAAFDQLVGMEDTQPGTDGYWGLTTTTAVDQIRLLQAVVEPGSLLSEASRAYELGLMENIEAGENWGVSSGPPSGVTVALKNGWLPLDDDYTDWQINSIGWIDGDSEDYLIAVLTNGDSSETYGIDTVEGLSSMVWTQIGTGG